MNNLYTSADLSRKINQLSAEMKMQETFIHIIYNSMDHGAEALAHAQRAIDEIKYPKRPVNER